MPSKESLLTTQQVADLLPARRGGRPTLAKTVRSWMTEGLRGVVLQHQSIGGSRLTTEEWLQEFLEREQHAAPLTYEAARAEAIRAGKVLVVGVGVEPPAGDWLAVKVDKLDGFSAPSVVISYPEGDKLWWGATYPMAANAVQVQMIVDLIPGHGKRKAKNISTSAAPC